MEIGKQLNSALIITMDFLLGRINSISSLEERHLTALFYYGYKSMALRRMSWLYVKGHAALSS